MLSINRGKSLIILAGLAVSLSSFSACVCKRVQGGGAGEGGEGAGTIPVATPGDVLSDINFDFDKSEIKASEKAKLQANAEWIKAHSSAAITVEGHCDERGTNEYNLALGERRAKSVERYLGTLGVSEKQLSTVTYGEEVPLDPAHNETAWAKNRRAHFAVK